MARRSAPSPSRWVAKLWRRAWGETRGVPEARPRRVSSRRTARGPSRRPRGREKQGVAVVRSAWGAGAGQAVDAPIEVGGVGLTRLRPERHDPVLAPLALPNPHDRAAAIDLHVADVEVAGLGDAQPGAVDHLEEGRLERAGAGVVAQRLVARAPVQQPAHVVLAEEGRQALGSLGGAQRGHRARLAEAAAHRQAKERAQRGQLSSDRHGVVLSMQRRKVGAAEDDVKLVEGRGTPQHPLGVAPQLVEVVQVGAHGVLRRPLLGGEELTKRRERLLHRRGS